MEEELYPGLVDQADFQQQREEDDVLSKVINMCQVMEGTVKWRVGVPFPFHIENRRLTIRTVFILGEFIGVQCSK